MVGGTSVAVASTSTSFGSVASKSVSGGILTIVSMAGSRDAWFRLATGIFGSDATAQGGGKLMDAKLPRQEANGMLFFQAW